MKKLALTILAAFAMSGCAQMPERTCTAYYESGGATYEVYVFGTRIVGDQLMLRAGYPFSFHYVSENQFKDHTCSG